MRVCVYSSRFSYAPFYNLILEFFRDDDRLKIHVHYGGLMALEGDKLNYKDGTTAPFMYVDPDYITFSIFEDFKRSQDEVSDVEQLWYRLPDQELSLERSIYEDKDKQLMQMCREAEECGELHIYVGHRVRPLDPEQVRQEVHLEAEKEVPEMADVGDRDVSMEAGEDVSKEAEKEAQNEAGREADKEVGDGYMEEATEAGIEVDEDHEEESDLGDGEEMESDSSVDDRDDEERDEEDIDEEDKDEEEVIGETGIEPDDVEEILGEGADDPRFADLFAEAETRFRDAPQQPPHVAGEDGYDIGEEETEAEDRVEEEMET